MDIFLSVNNREQIIQLPIVPKEFMITSPVNNETFTTINQGDLLLLGENGLKGLLIDSFFPHHDKNYPFARANKYKRWEYIEMIEGWKKNKLRVRMIATGSPINMVMGIADFTYGYKDGSGDIYYTLTLTEYKDIKLQKKKVAPANKKGHEVREIRGAK